VPINALVVHMIQINQVVISELKAWGLPAMVVWVKHWRPLVVTEQPPSRKRPPGM